MLYALYFDHVLPPLQPDNPQSVSVDPTELPFAHVAPNEGSAGHAVLAQGAQPTGRAPEKYCSAPKAGKILKKRKRRKVKKITPKLIKKLILFIKLLLV